MPQQRPYAASDGAAERWRSTTRVGGRSATANTLPYAGCALPRHSVASAVLAGR
ncbi:MAG: hypothetical protein ACI841_003485 [Planctomycetota bacterium]|jgi:hypothetical protein